MKCPFCGNLDTQVVETRTSEDGDSVRRRRQCSACERRYTTAGQSPYAGIPFRKALSEIRNPDGSWYPQTPTSPISNPPVVTY